MRIIKHELVMSQNLSRECCHASTLAVLEKEELVCAWFQGSKEGADDVKIWGSRRINGSWETPVILADHHGIPCWNPVLFVRSDGAIVLYYKVGHTIAKWQTMYKISKDKGTSWSQEKELVPGDFGGRGPVRNKITVLKDGRLLAPASLEDGEWRCFADISDDEGHSWRKSCEVEIKLAKRQKRNCNYKEIPVSEQSFGGRGVIQPSFWQTGDQVHMVMRSTEGSIFHSVSTDRGENFLAPMAMEIPNNNSGIDAVKASDGRVYLVCNPVGESWGKRTPLCVFVSDNDGMTWELEWTLEDEEGEFSYPGILYNDGKLYIVYTWKRLNIAFWEIELSK